MATNSKPTQCYRILLYMQDFGSISQIEALQDLGVMRLASRISEIKKTHRVKKEMVKGTNRYGEPVSYARYSLIKEET